jgi:hypothetical protein
MTIIDPHERPEHYEFAVRQADLCGRHGRNDHQQPNHKSQAQPHERILRRSAVSGTPHDAVGAAPDQDCHRGVSRGADRIAVATFARVVDETIRRLAGCTTNVLRPL